MSKRYNSVISKQSDESYSEDHWLKEFEATLQKTSVQPRGDSTYDQISSIMNTKSKYPSVQAAVDDMMQRSGLSSYLDNVKVSYDKTPPQPKKTAQQAPVDNKLPKIIQEKRDILNTLENIVKDTKGNISVPAIISRLHSFHAGVVSDENAWEDEKLIRLVSLMNLNAKKNNPTNYENYRNLGQGDRSMDNTDVDVSNTDAFNALMPAKL